MAWFESHAVSTQKLMTPINHELQSELVATAEAQTASSALNLMAHGRVADWVRGKFKRKDWPKPNRAMTKSCHIWLQTDARQILPLLSDSLVQACLSVFSESVSSWC